MKKRGRERTAASGFVRRESEKSSRIDGWDWSLIAEEGVVSRSLGWQRDVEIAANDRGAAALEQKQKPLYYQPLCATTRHRGFATYIYVYSI